jgi:hypothetical protein
VREPWRRKVSRSDLSLVCTSLGELSLCSRRIGSRHVRGGSLRGAEMEKFRTVATRDGSISVLLMGDNVAEIGLEEPFNSICLLTWGHLRSC